MDDLLPLTDSPFSSLICSVSNSFAADRPVLFFLSSSSDEKTKRRINGEGNTSSNLFLLTLPCKDTFLMHPSSYLKQCWLFLEHCNHREVASALLHVQDPTQCDVRPLMAPRRHLPVHSTPLFRCETKMAG
jgi:hypothetical protein